MTKGTKDFLKSACVLALSALFMRTVSVSFQSYVSEKLGAEGMGLYTLISTLYGFAVTFATSGVSLAVTRLVSESLGRQDVPTAREALSHAGRYALLFSSVATVVLFFGATVLGGTVLGDVRTVLPLKVLALSLIPLSLSSVMVGYFTAVGRVTAHAVIQVAEFGVRMVATSVLFGILLPYGTVWACVAVVGANTLAQLFSTAVLALRYGWDLRRYLPKKAGDLPRAGGVGRLCHIALPVAFSAYVRSGLLTVEHILIPRSLSRGGISHADALASYGVLSGMSLPIVMYPFGILTSFSSLLVPVFAERRAREEGRDIRRLATRALHLTSVGAIGCTAVLATFAREIGEVLYRSGEAGAYILPLSFVLPLMFLDHVTDCILKGLGEQVWTMWVNIVDSFFSIVLVVGLLPVFGAMGYVYVIILAEVFNFALSISRLKRVSRVRYDLLRSALLPCLSAVLAGTAVRVLTPILPHESGLGWLLVRMVFAACVYGSLTVLFSLIKSPQGLTSPARGCIMEVSKRKEAQHDRT